LWVVTACFSDLSSWCTTHITSSCLRVRSLGAYHQSSEPACVLWRAERSGLLARACRFYRDRSQPSATRGRALHAAFNFSGRHSSGSRWQRCCTNPSTDKTSMLFEFGAPDSTRTRETQRVPALRCVYPCIWSGPLGFKLDSTKYALMRPPQLSCACPTTLSHASSTCALQHCCVSCISYFETSSPRSMGVGLGVRAWTTAVR
jgi:hypothetical protein